MQPHEADAVTFMHVLRQATRWARAVRPTVAVTFVLSTNTRNRATAAAMDDDYAQAEFYLGGAAPWWLNIIPENGDATVGVPTAEAVLAGAS